MCCLGFAWPEGFPSTKRHPRVLRANRFCFAFKNFAGNTPLSLGRTTTPKKHFAAVPNHLKINSGLFAKRFAEQVLSRASRGKHSDEAKKLGKAGGGPELLSGPMMAVAKEPSPLIRRERAKACLLPNRYLKMPRKVLFHQCKFLRVRCIRTNRFISPSAPCGCLVWIFGF